MLLKLHYIHTWGKLIRMALPLCDSQGSLLWKAGTAPSFPITFPRNEEDKERQNRYSTEKRKAAVGVEREKKLKGESRRCKAPKDRPTMRDRRARQIAFFFPLLFRRCGGGRRRGWKRRVDNGWWHYRLHGWQGGLSPKPSLIRYASTLAGTAVLLKVRVGGCRDDGRARSDEHPTFGLTSLNFNHFGLGLIGPWGGSEAGKGMGRGGEL